jgi:hypothetical protein
MTNMKYEAMVQLDHECMEELIWRIPHLRQRHVRAIITPVVELMIMSNA